MTKLPPSPKGSRKQPPIDRRLAASPAGNATGDAPGTLRKVKGALGRPLGLERKGGQLRVVLVERRRTAPADQAPMLARIRAELRERLEDLADTPAEHLMRHLGFVGAELERRGWSGVEALPGSVLGKALVQAEMLASGNPSELLTIFVERLRLLKVAAEVREERASRLAGLDDASLVVSESTHEDFEASLRSWADSLAADMGGARDGSNGRDRKPR